MLRADLEPLRARMAEMERALEHQSRFGGPQLWPSIASPIAAMPPACSRLALLMPAINADTWRTLSTTSGMPWARLLPSGITAMGASANLRAVSS